MARTAVTLNAVTPDSGTGVDVATALAAIEDTDGNYIDNVSGRVLVVVQTEATSGATLGVVSVADPYGRLGDLTSGAIGASALKVFGPFTPLLFNQGGASSGRVHFDWTSVTGTVKIAAISY